MKAPEIVKLSTQDIKYDIPLSLEEVVLKHFRYSKNPNDKLYTTEIIEYIEKVGYEYPVNQKELSSIIIKTGVGYKNVSGKVSKNNKQLHGYSNIVFNSPNEDIDLD